MRVTKREPLQVRVEHSHTLVKGLRRLQGLRINEIVEHLCHLNHQLIAPNPGIVVNL